MLNKIFNAIDCFACDAERITTVKFPEWGHSQEAYYKIRLQEFISKIPCYACIAEMAYSNVESGHITLPIVKNGGAKMDLLVFARDGTDTNDTAIHKAVCAIEIKYSGGYNGRSIKSDISRLITTSEEKHICALFIHIYSKKQKSIIKHISAFFKKNNDAYTHETRNLCVKDGCVTIVLIGRPHNK